ncbi:MAG: acyl-CoA desaturase [Polyangiaceae bacterium]
METPRDHVRENMNWAASVPFILIHLVPLAIIFTGVTARSVILCVTLYFVRMFFITAGFHRYFSHRSYKMGRIMQFLMAFGGTTSAQKGVLWWAAHHRHHHKHSDEESDIHSPRHGFWWSHAGWILCDKYNETRFDLIPDLAKYPELRWLNRFHLVPPIMLAIACVAIDGWSGLVIGFFLSTAVLYHGTFTINSLTHVFGRRRYVTADTSRNSLILALITLGEGWHNNHHYYQRATNQGFFWWEIDISFYVLKLLSWMRLVRGIHTPPQRVLDGNRVKDGCIDVGMLTARGKFLSA